MARNVRLVTGAAESELARQQQLADALTARAMRPVVPPPSGGPMTTALSPWQGLAQLGEAFVAGRLNRVLAERERAQQDEQRQANAAKVEALTRSPMLERMDPSGRPNGQSVAPPQDFETGAPMLSSKGELLAAAMRGMEPGAAGQVLSQQLFARALPGPQDYKQVDLGNQIAFVDASGNIVRTMPKAASPDVALREQGENQRFAGVSGGARLSAETARRNAELAAATSRQNAELAARTAARNAGAPAGGTNPFGYNDRQMSGLSTQQDAVLNYAASLTGLPRAQIDQILATEGPEGVAKVMQEKGGRFIQGKTAMAIGAVPFIGDTIVNMANPDLVAPREAGASGVAAFQNPAGMITNADILVGRAQMPQATYPLETQASIVQQTLERAAKARGEQPAGMEQPIPFASEDEALKAEAAGILQKGQRVIINGVPGTWQ